MPASGPAAASDELSDGGIVGIRVTEAAGHIIVDNEMETGIIASVVQTQAGGTPIVSSWNEVATVANFADAVTLMSATAGRIVMIINNGANFMSVFPDVGQDLGMGVDVAELIAPNLEVMYWGFSATQWREF